MSRGYFCQANLQEKRPVVQQETRFPYTIAPRVLDEVSEVENTALYRLRQDGWLYTKYVKTAVEKAVLSELIRRGYVDLLGAPEKRFYMLNGAGRSYCFRNAEAGSK